MGILNVTPDSFSDGGRFFDQDAAVERGVEMAAQGAAIIDIGGESTRPWAVGVSAAEELRRVLPVVKRLAHRVRVPISVDTSKAPVAEAALDAGAMIINDISALRTDPAMASVVASHEATVILMHMAGTPATMQQRPRYRHVTQDVCRFLRGAVERAEAGGITHKRIWLDPGLGFGKTVRHNLQLLRELELIVALGYPVVLGPSRKFFIGETVEAPIDDRLAGTLACVEQAQRCRVHVVRVHDVPQTVQFLRMCEAIACV